MPAISIATPFNIDLEFNIASVGKRFLGYVIDLILLYIYLRIAAPLLDAIRGQYTSSGFDMLVKLFFYFPMLLYGFALEALLNGQTVGKMLLGMRVVNMTGNRASLSQYLIRALFSPTVLIVPIGILSNDLLQYMGGIYALFVLFFIGIFILFVLSDKVQRLGDRLANTLVINTKAKADIHTTIFREVSDTNYTVRFPEVMRLTDRDINGIRNLLNMKAGNKDTENYIARIAGRVVTILKIETQLDPRDFLEQLLLDYNYLSRKG